MLRLTFAALFLASVAQATQFLNCETGDRPILDLSVEGCEELPCNFIRGQDIAGYVNFDVETAAAVLKPLIRVKAFGFWVEYPIGYDDACEHLYEGNCPMAPGDKAVYDMRIPVLTSYPKISIDVEVSLKNEDNVVLACYRLAGQVVD